MLETLPRRSGRRRERRERRWGLWTLTALVIIVVMGFAGAGLYYRWATGASGPQRPVEVIIPSGATGQQVAGILKTNGVIRSTFGFRLEARFHGQEHNFLAGRYALTTNMTVSAVLSALAKGPSVQAIRVTFPEGLTVAETAARAHKDLGISVKEFVKLANSGKYALPPFLPAGTKPVEGSLFPNTYDFFADATPDQVIPRLLHQFDTEAAKLRWSKAKALGVSPFQVVIIASLIEKEAKFEPDRAKVAEVIYNRLKAHMPLQFDTTIVYALGKHTTKLSLQDLKVNSPYNTYLHTGLPPSAIASPGIASLGAALSPAQGNLLYFVTDAKGHAHFAATQAQFNQLKNKYVHSGA